MKQADVKLGATYLTLVGGRLVLVMVRGQVRGARGLRYLVQRVDNGKQLPKARSAAALREDGPDWQGEVAPVLGWRPPRGIHSCHADCPCQVARA
jgi:hypothetical protein